MQPTLFEKSRKGIDSLAAYRKFLRGEKLAELQAQEMLSTDLPSKIHRIQAALPQWVEVHGPMQVKPLMGKLNTALKARQFDQATKTADEILKLLEQHE